MGGVWKKGPGIGLFKSLNDVSQPLKHSVACAVESRADTAVCMLRKLNVQLAVTWCIAQSDAYCLDSTSANLCHGADNTHVSGALQQLGYVPIIAEDLGVITTDVNELRKAIGAPGMVVLQFAWGSGSTNTHIPHNHYENSVCYPGGLRQLCH